MVEPDMRSAVLQQLKFENVNVPWVSDQVYQSGMLPATSKETLNPGSLDLWGVDEKQTAGSAPVGRPKTIFSIDTANYWYRYCTWTASFIFNFNPT